LYPPLTTLAIRAALVAITTASALVTALPPVPGAATVATPTVPDPADPGLVRPAPAASAHPAPTIPAPLTPPTPAPAPRPTPITVVTVVAISAPVNPAVAAAPVAAVTSSVGTSAMRRALGKVGSPYRWGAAGPNAFDCSGLVTWAYRNTGVSLPRSSRAMSRIGTAVSRADLRPGDLVFFYRPVSHVGIYIGGGRIVHASSKRYPVKISDMGRMKFATARRI
jgi:cell wall-associated NlpC family hydrolase